MEKRVAELMGGKPTAKAPAAPTAETETTPTTEAETTPEAERRTNLALRAEVDKLSPEEKDEVIRDLRARVFTDELTGLKNRAAYMIDEKQPFQAIIDLDNLKWVNDNIGHGAGDTLIKTLAAELPEGSYRLSGDEFVVQGQSQEELASALSDIETRLNEQVLELAGDKQTVSKKGIGFSYGIGETLDKAETALQEHKKARLAEGKRAERGEVPPGIDISKREEDTIQTIKPNSVVRSTAGSTAGKLYTVLKIDGNKATVKSHDTGQNYRLKVSTLELVEDSAAGTGPEPEGKAAAKEPWEMTREEWHNQEMSKRFEAEQERLRKQGIMANNYSMIEAGLLWDHKQAVQQALSEGKPVPPEVLKDYPELKPAAKGKPSEPFSMANRTMQPFPTKKDPLSLFNKTIPKKHKITVLENLVVRDGIAYGTNLEITVAAKTNLEDGIYKITGKEGSLKTVKVDGDLDEYPDMSIKIEEDAPRDVLDIGKLRPALQRSLDYVGDDKVRAAFKNISLTVKDGEMAIVASDAYRMTIHKAKTNLPDGQYLINSDAVKLLLADKSISKAELVYGKEEVAIDTGNAVIFHRNLALKYPELTNIIPKEVKTVLLADKKDFLAKIKEVKEMKPGISPVAVFLTDKGLELKSHSSINNKEFTVVLPVKYFKRKRNTLLEPLNTVDMVLPVKGKAGERSLLGSKTEDAALLNLNHVEKAVKHIEGSDAYMSFAGNHLSPVLFTGKILLVNMKSFQTQKPLQRGTGKAEKKLDQVMTELGEEVDRVVGDTNFPIGQSIRIVNNVTKASPTANGTFSSADPR